ncbi:MAG: OmpA family protein [Bryobacterales bacterium]|nr:OmpA family protein [Bryobacterales bacterium]
MRSFVPKAATIAGVVFLTALFTQGCATKKYVNQQISPVDQRVAEVSHKTDENGKSIAELSDKTDASVSRLDENIKTAERIAQDATRLAQGAGDTANAAYGATQENKVRLAGLEKRLDGVYNYELKATESIRFGFDRSDLNDESKAALNEFMNKIKGSPNFVVEVQGYTDKTGSTKYNLDLSEKRADAVVRYLATTYSVPLRSIHKLGVGSEDPVADNTTRTGREQNRRVEVRVFVPVDAPSTAVSATSSTSTAAARYE